MMEYKWPMLCETKMSSKLHYHKSKNLLIAQGEKRTNDIPKLANPKKKKKDLKTQDPIQISLGIIF